MVACGAVEGGSRRGGESHTPAPAEPAPLHTGPISTTQRLRRRRARLLQHPERERRDEDRLRGAELARGDHVRHHPRVPHLDNLQDLGALREVAEGRGVAELPLLLREEVKGLRRGRRGVGRLGG